MSKIKRFFAINGVTFTALLVLFHVIPNSFYS